MGVLDSGATRAVKPKEPRDQELREVHVELAGDVETETMMTKENIVIGAPGSQMIVPLVPLVRDLQCTLHTNEEGKLELRHPRRGKIYLDQRSGSPLTQEMFAGR